MEFVVKKRQDGLFEPHTKRAQERAIKVPVGALCKTEHTRGRNYGNLSRFHVFIDMLWENLSDEWQEKFKNQDNFRYAIEFLAGAVDGIPLPNNEIIQKVKSISYDNMPDENEFKKVFSDVIDAALKYNRDWTKKEIIERVEYEIMGFV